MLRGSAVVILILVELSGMWFSQSHITWSTGNKIAVPIPRIQGVKVKVTSVHKLMWKNTNSFFVFQDRSIPDVSGDICPCICNHQTAYIAYWCVYCLKNEAIYAEIPCFGGTVFL